MIAQGATLGTGSTSSRLEMAHSGRRRADLHGAARTFASQHAQKSSPTRQVPGCQSIIRAVYTDPLSEIVMKKVCVSNLLQGGMNDQGLSIHDFVAHPVGAYRIRPYRYPTTECRSGSAADDRDPLCETSYRGADARRPRPRGREHTVKYVTDHRVSKATQQMPTRRSRRSHSGFFE